MNNAIELIGIALLICGVILFSVPLGLITAGFALVLLANARASRRKTPE